MDSPKPAPPDALVWTAGKWRFNCFIDIPTAERLKRAGFDFVDHEAFSKQLADPYKAADFAVELHRDQFEAADLDELAFLDLCTAEDGKLAEVLECCIRGVVSFLSRRLDPVRAGIIRKAWEAAKRGANELSNSLETNSNVDAAIAAQIARAERAFDRELERLISGETSASSAENGADR